MNPTPNEDRFAPPWFLIVGLCVAGAFLVLMTWDSFAPKSENVMEFTNANWQKEVVESKIPVLVDFGASWCGPCRSLAPTIDRLAVRYKGKVKVGKVDVDNAGEIAAKYKVNGIPHVFLFNGGEKPVASLVGADHAEADYAKAIEMALAQR